MPRRLSAGGVALHAAWIGRRAAALPTREAAVRRPSDQGGPTSTSWPRARNSLMVASGSRFSTTSTPGRAVRGQNEIGKCSECQAGASMASCRFMPA